jgi:hypothetical protein
MDDWRTRMERLLTPLPSPPSGGYEPRPSPEALRLRALDTLDRAVTTLSRALEDANRLIDGRCRVAATLHRTAADGTLVIGPHSVGFECDAENLRLRLFCDGQKIDELFYRDESRALVLSSAAHSDVHVEQLFGEMLLSMVGKVRDLAPGVLVVNHHAQQNS